MFQHIFVAHNFDPSMGVKLTIWLITIKILVKGVKPSLIWKFKT
jgi:hypothetical protein